MAKYLKIVTAELVSNYRLVLVFNDKKTVTVDFEEFLRKSSHSEVQKYIKPSLFKKFKLADGELMWGDFDLIFPIQDLYEGNILNKKVPRSKTVS